ncbi:MAG: NAD+ synthase, partial [Candidatus Latescibacterota bacterium]
AAVERSDLVVFPELYITGYPPRDLLDQPAFIDEAQLGLERLVDATAECASPAVLVGCPRPTGFSEGTGLYNNVILVSQGKVVFEQSKSLLPTYDVFDEARYFDPAKRISTVAFAGENLGLSICEDSWSDASIWDQNPYPYDPIHVLAKGGASLMINISASPFTVGKERMRHQLIRGHARKHGVPFVFVNQVGGNDELIFDGRSLFVDKYGDVQAALPPFVEGLRTIDTGAGKDASTYQLQDEVEAVFQALTLGTRDYVQKCGFSKVVIGLSGGIDSSVTAAIAAEALGPGNVLALSLPSPYSSRASVEDTKQLVKNLGIGWEIIDISDTMSAYDGMLSKPFSGREKDVTEENIQARIRGNVLMAFANKFGLLPLSTGNKSELAVGYCTLYGDMSGGLAVISDVPKTFVYQIANWINRDGEVIPKAIIDKPPSAELKPGQLDQDILPPYDVLDPILESHIDRGRSLEEIVREGFERRTVAWVLDAVRKNEYKRRQAPPGLKITSKAFGSGRRMPIAAKYKS